MSRHLLPCPSAPVTRPSATDPYLVHVITPMFGGGVEAGKTDPSGPIRGTAVRGALRFWWRALRGASCEGVAALREREGQIWGTTERDSRVRVAVRIVNAGQAEDIDRNYPAYAVFPFRETRQKALRGVQFSLIVDTPEEFELDVEAALWGWLNFGGVGARTRRGCGALHCDKFAPRDGNKDAVKKWLADSNKRYEWTQPKSDLPWPCFAFAPIVSNKSADPIEAWKSAVGLLQKFRQGEGVGRNPGARGRPGRSRWPEADSLRSITGAAEPRHRASTTLPGPRLDPAFPRAEFGLPIVFHFTRNDPGDEPNNCELYPDRNPQSTRMASPLILRPLGVGNGREALTMVLQLRTPRPENLKLEKLAAPPALGNRNIRRSDLGTYTNSPMKGSVSALDAFRKFAAGNI